MINADFIEKITKSIDSLKAPQELADEVFPELDCSLGNADDSIKRKVVALLEKAEEKVRQLGEAKSAWWLSEIYLRKGRYARGIVNKKREYSHWKDAYVYAVEADNYEMSVQSSLELGFTFVEFTSSLRDILEIQMNCVKAICAGDVATTSRLRIIGINLYDFWRRLEYRRLSEHDLKAKQYIIDCAKSLQSADFDDDAAAPLMILLISKVFGFDSPALEWAKMEAGVLFIPIPEDVKEKLGGA